MRLHEQASVPAAVQVEYDRLLETGHEEEARTLLHRHREVPSIDPLEFGPAFLLAALYNGSSLRGNGWLADPTFGGKRHTMTIEEAEEIIEARKKYGSRMYFDYVLGRVIKTDLAYPQSFFYERDNGPGSFMDAIYDQLERETS